MLETSQDVLHWALAIGAFVALIGLAFVFFYTAKILRQVLKAMSTIEGAFEAVRTMLKRIGERLSNASAVSKFAVDVVKLIVDAKEVKKEVSKKSSTKKKK